MFGDDDDKIICPSCGNKIESGISACGFCGYLLSGDNPPDFQPPAPLDDDAAFAAGGGAAVAPGGGASEGGVGYGLPTGVSPMPPPQGPPYDPTGTGVTSGSRPGSAITKIIVLVVALSIIGGAAVPIILALREVDEAFDSIPDVDLGGGFGVGGSGKDPLELEGAYRNSRSLVADLRKNGVNCNKLDVATRNTFLEVATCYVKDDPVNTQIYFDSTALNGVLGSVGNLKSSNVVHDANWVIMTPTNRRLAKGIRFALGGKLE